MEEFLSTNQLFIVLFVVLLVWGGIVAYLFRLDKKIRKLEHHMKKES
ncbi:MAG: CcmD family protein [Bacteroidota bacterium]